jgi:hypothetical protein
MAHQIFMIKTEAVAEIPLRFDACHLRFSSWISWCQARPAAARGVGPLHWDDAALQSFIVEGCAVVEDSALAPTLHQVLGIACWQKGVGGPPRVARRPRGL